MPSPKQNPDDASHEPTIGPADMDPEGPEFDPQYQLVQSDFGLHVRLGKEADEGLRSENDIAELVRSALFNGKTLTLHIELGRAHPPANCE